MREEKERGKERCLKKREKDCKSGKHQRVKILIVSIISMLMLAFGYIASS